MWGPDRHFSKNKPNLIELLSTHQKRTSEHTTVNLLIISRNNNNNGNAVACHPCTLWLVSILCRCFSRTNDSEKAKKGLRCLEVSTGDHTVSRVHKDPLQPHRRTKTRVCVRMCVCGFIILRGCSEPFVAVKKKLMPFYGHLCSWALPSDHGFLNIYSAARLFFFFRLTINK